MRSLGGIHLGCPIVEARDQGWGKRAPSKHLFPFIGYTIGTHLADAFVAVTGAGHRLIPGLYLVEEVVVIFK